MKHTMNIDSQRAMKARQQAAIALVLISVLVGAAFGLGAERANADVTLSVSIRPSVSATFTSEGVTVLSNTPWQIEIATHANGHGTVFFSGGPTGSAGETVPVGPEAEILSVVALDR